MVTDKYHTSSEVRNMRAIKQELVDIIEGAKVILSNRDKMPRDCQNLFDKIVMQQMTKYNKYKDVIWNNIYYQVEAAVIAHACVEIYQERHRNIYTIIKYRFFK